MRKPLPVIARCQHLLKDHRNNYTCQARGGAACGEIAQGPDLSACPDFVGPFGRPPRPAGGMSDIDRRLTNPSADADQDDDQEDDFIEYCPCAKRPEK